MLAVLMVPISYAQEMNGTWKGILNAGNQELEIVFHFNYQENGNSTAKMDVPAQRSLGNTGESEISVNRFCQSGSVSSINGLYR